MFASRSLSRHCSRTCQWSLSSLLQSVSGRNVVLSSSPVTSIGSSSEGNSNLFQPLMNQVFKGWCRAMSTSRGRSMRSKVESRMRKESGKTLREIRRAKKLKKKLMTDEERLIYNLKRAKKKVALLLQKLKKYDLPELPSPVHDPELFTSEQVQAFKKIGFKNKNYVPVGVRGVFGGVVQNMHMHWKFHETVQVCCDNFPKEKIKEMASMIARLSGGVVINIHNVKTIIMFRGRNYRQPKNLIPVNTLTKRKALFKARFEQALESQKLNIKKTEQQLRRMGVNPEDPVAMASIQRVASTFFNAIDKKEGTPYVFHGGKQSERGASDDNREESEPGDEDSDQEELDRFIAEIEEAADKEWEEEEAAEQEESGRIRYWNREEFAGRSRTPELRSYGDASHGFRRYERDTHSQRRPNDSDEDDEGELDSEDDEIPKRFDRARSSNTNTRRPREDIKRRSPDPRPQPQVRSDDDVLSDLDNTMWDSEDEEDAPPANFISSSDDDEDENRTISASASKQPRFRNNNSSRDGINNSKTKSGKQRDEDWDSD
ncbi:RNA-binding CRM domain [Arabidopsis thaliana x Arabidopsis arenosa]|uniref:RNA-binding CRM domain n=1 Tax=Arabidopsis thaliana x Arabidopsis arenosa TaxID=1240361 RepID=A0A8T1ZL90_9BRAS|nr:RNA-binding CRM domain [Arabidopsis thaliana x Arabidopsis arenosa]